MQETPPVLVLTRQPEAYERELAERGVPAGAVNGAAAPEAAMDAARDARIILGDPDLVARVLPAAERLAWVQSTFAGVDALMSKGLRRDYILTNIKGVFGPIMREYVFAYILALERRVLEMHANQRAGLWRELRYRPLSGKVMAICGAGDIGCAIAETALHFGLSVRGLKRTPGPAPPVTEIYQPDRFHDFLAGADYVVITLPDTPETHHLFDEAAFDAMAARALLINVGRGAVVDEAALVRAIRKERIRGAVLDVFETEPLPDSSPLWRLPGVYVTPHRAAFSFARDIAGVFAENYHRYRSGRPLRHVVPFGRGY